MKKHIQWLDIMGFIPMWIMFTIMSMDISWNLYIFLAVIDRLFTSIYIYVYTYMFFFCISLDLYIVFNFSGFR